MLTVVVCLLTDGLLTYDAEPKLNSTPIIAGNKLLQEACVATGSDDPFVCARLRAARCSQARVRVGLDASMRRGILVASECPSLQHSFVACTQSSRHGASQPWCFALLAQYPSMSMGGLNSGGWYSSSSFLNHLPTSQHQLQAGETAEARPRGRCVRTPATP